MAKAKSAAKKSAAKKSAAKPEIAEDALEPNQEELETEEVTGEEPEPQEDTLEAKKVRLETEIAEVQAEIAQLKKHEDLLTKELDSVLHYIEGDASPSSNMSGILDYIAAQNRHRQERAGVAVQSTATAPIDAALSAKHKRPQYPTT
jgi:hypothetical protein